jgi:hypothetical protein
MVLLWLAACTGPSDPPRDRGDDDTDPPATDGTEPTGTTGATGTTGFTGETAEEDLCAELPPVPLVYDVINDFETAEDFDLDVDGFLCTILSNNLTCKNQAGDFKVLSPNVAQITAGTRVLPTGDWVVADVGNGALVRIDTATGAKSVVLGGLQYPNGVEVGRDGWVFVAENNGSKVRQVDPYTGDQHLVANGLLAPNGVILSPDEQTMYVGSFGGGLIYAIDRLGPTEWDEARVLYDPPGPDGGFDGINVDSCGNVYITEYIKGRIYRITPDGLTRDLVVDFQDSWIPNMRWGHGVGGWETDILYVTAWDRILALHAGLPGKTHVAFPEE